MTILRVGGQDLVLDSSAGVDSARLRISGASVLAEIGDREILSQEINAAGRNGGSVEFLLAIPGKISRRFLGTLKVNAVRGVLVPIVSMELEVAVASSVQAESAPGASLEALKAQAVAARSYFVAALGRHHDFDFCDTTHCQFLRQPPVLGSPAELAARSTKGLVLAYRGQPFAAMFTRSCGGRTRTPEEIGLCDRGYPYFRVICDFCRTHPVQWIRRVPRQDADRISRLGEAGRLEVDRRLGWAAVPSDAFVVRDAGQDALLEGSGQGHGVGLCQRGAQAMAAQGADFRQILGHYFPETTLVPVHPQPWQSITDAPLPPTTPQE